jgi:hypothetical protein
MSELRLSALRCRELYSAMEFENLTTEAYSAWLAQGSTQDVSQSVSQSVTQSSQRSEPAFTRNAYLRPSEYVYLFDAANDHRDMFKPIIKGRHFRDAQAMRKQFWTAVKDQLKETLGREFKIDEAQRSHEDAA